MSRPSLPDVSSPRGAPMGRRSTWPVPLSAEKFTKPERDTLRLPIGGAWRKVSTAKRGA